MSKRWRNKLLRPEFEKNWDRSAPSFANINILGKCNADCYFCLGKDIDPIFSNQNQMRDHFSTWKKFDEFLDICEQRNIPNIYVTGQNTDALMYRYLSEILDYGQGRGFKMGLRTNGFLAPKKMDAIAKCIANPGFSIHTRDFDTQQLMMGKSPMPDWEKILTEVDHCRVSIVASKYNVAEIPEMLEWLGKFPSVQYVQVRRICTDSREDFLIEDARCFDRLLADIDKEHTQVGEFYAAPVYSIAGKDVCFWQTVKTDIDSVNYFTDGTISDEYFVIEGYMRESENFPKLKGIPINAHGMGLEGYWRKQKASVSV